MSAGPALRLVLVTRRYPPLLGGAEKVLSYLAEALAEAGATVTVLTSRVDPGLPPVERPRANLTVVRLGTSRLRFVGTWLYMRNIRRWFAFNPVDAAYASMLKHDAHAVVGEGLRRGFPSVLRPEGAGATGDVVWQARGRFGSTIAARCKRADAIVSISPAVRRELIGAGYDPARIVDLPNGVPVSEVPWSRAGARAESAVFVGRLAPEKGLGALIDAWPIVTRSRPDARLTLVGDGPERRSLEARAAAVGAAAAVVFAGASTDPSNHLRASDLFVLPSREEGMSVALLEAMALGMPIVASDIPGNRGLVVDGAQGRLVPPDHPQALAGAILRSWSDPAEGDATGRAARERAIAEFSIRAVAERHLDLFRSLIAR